MLDTMIVTVPEGICGDTSIRRVIAGPPSFWALTHEPDRMIPEGAEFTALYCSGELWMSDTPAERRDHYPALRMAYQLAARRVLINGLGLGMVVQGLLQIPNVEHIDVVEINPDVIALVGDHYRQQAAAMGKVVDIHQGDAYTIRWPRGTFWDIAWSDIWRTACTTNLPEMTRLSRRYGTRIRWHGHWLRDQLLERRRKELRLHRQRTA